MIEIFDTLLSVMYWFARPSIAAWAGAVATVVAVFLAEIRRNVRQPCRFLRRMPRILIIWLVVAWCLSQLAGRGLGGAGTGGGKGDAIGPWLHSHTAPGGDTLTIRLRFIPQKDNPDLASDFVCMVRLETESDAQESKVVGDTLAEFEQQLERTLKGISEPPGRVVVEKQPSPGEGVLRRIRIIVQKRWPDVPYAEVASP